MFRLQGIHRFIYKYYWLLLLATVGLTVLGARWASRLSLESDLTQLLPESFESVKTLNRIRDEVGGVGHLRIILETQNFEAAKRFAHDLEPTLLRSPMVNYVDYRNDVEFYRRNALLFLDLAELDSLHRAIEKKIEREKQKLNPLFVEDLFADDVEEEDELDLAEWEEKYESKEPKEYYTNEDSTVLVIKVFPAETNTSLKFVRNMFDEVQGIVSQLHPERYHPSLKIYYGGSFKNRLDEYEVVSHDILGTAIYGFGGVFLLIVIYFRRLSGALLITVTLLCSLAWTFGVTYLAIGNLNTITGFLFVILFGLGIDYGIHALARYAEERSGGATVLEALEKLVSRTGKALATTAVTTSAAFFSLLLMDFKGFSELGFISGLGILFALVAMVVVLPALLTLFEKLGILRFKLKPNSELSFQPTEFRHARPILIGTLFGSLLALIGVFNLEFEYDFTNLRAITEERELVSEKTKGIFDLSESPAVVLADSRAEVAEIVEAVEAIKAKDTASPTIDAVRSVFSLVPPNQEAKLAKIRAIRELIEEEAEGVVKGKDKERLDKLNQYLQVDRPFTWDEFPEKDKRQFINKRGEIGNFVFIYPNVPLRDGKNAIAFREDVATIRTKSGKVYHASSSNIVLAEMLLVMLREGRLAVGLTFVVVFLIVFVDFKSFKSSVFVLTPLALGILWMVGVMQLFGMKLNLFNIVVLPSVIGIGVDNGVHIYHRFKEEGAGSLYFVLRQTGLAITMTTLTTVVGYSGLIMAHHPGLNSIGKLAVIGLMSTYLAAMIVLPALLQVFRSHPVNGQPVKPELVRDATE